MEEVGFQLQANEIKLLFHFLPLFLVAGSKKAAPTWERLYFLLNSL